ncbi:MDHM protein, partial [Spelaeornis formosus]|nr:MDHM protein [Elachura formosa]
GETLAALVKRIQFGGDEVVKAKDGAGSATLSMAYAGADFTDSLLRAMNGEKDVKLCTYVESPLYKDQGVDFFSSPVSLTAEGTVGTIHPVGELHPTEQKLLEACLPDLKKNIAAGTAFIAKN